MRREYQLLDRAFDRVLARSKRDMAFHRTAAMAIGVERVRGAKETHVAYSHSASATAMMARNIPGQAVARHSSAVAFVTDLAAASMPIWY
ncbi:hypothetical protein [Bradyrhizobium zhanjiangense]|uniref:hypothetical protein n=1 Tax=Bradyrhizobium zhanjiangense TaxID=1325107 RepID=UPI001FE22079|nr:hypothetical protein [Bradyrhizobium zhanjiangense]